MPASPSPGDDMPEVQSFMADPAFIEERMDDVVGLVVTHAHEDHVGAIHHLWPRLTCPIYATPFATHLIRERLKEVGAARAVQVNTMPIGGRLKIGPFDIETIAVTHSVPEPISLAIRTKAGNLLHTGDWKFDPEPWSAPPPTSPPSSGSATRACSPWCATAPTPRSRAPPAPRGRPAPAWSRRSAAARVPSR